MAQKAGTTEGHPDPSVLEAFQKWRDLVRSKCSGVRKVDVRYPRISMPGETQAVEIRLTFRTGGTRT